MADVDEIFSQSVRTLLGDGDLAIRLLCIGTTMATLNPADFPLELRGQVDALRDDFTMLGLAGGFEDGRQHRDFSQDEATALALRVLEVAFRLATREGV